jgi:hypothetical protein
VEISTLLRFILTDHGKRVLYAGLNRGDFKLSERGEVLMSYGESAIDGPHWASIEKVTGENPVDVLNEGEYAEEDFRGGDTSA